MAKNFEDIKELYNEFKQINDAILDSKNVYNINIDMEKAYLYSAFITLALNIENGEKNNKLNISPIFKKYLDEGKIPAHDGSNLFYIDTNDKDEVSRISNNIREIRNAIAHGTFEIKGDKVIINNNESYKKKVLTVYLQMLFTANSIAFDTDFYKLEAVLIANTENVNNKFNNIKFENIIALSIAIKKNSNSTNFQQIKQMLLNFEYQKNTVQLILMHLKEYDNICKINNVEIEYEHHKVSDFSKDEFYKLKNSFSYFQPKNQEEAVSFMQHKIHEIKLFSDKEIIDNSICSYIKMIGNLKNISYDDLSKNNFRYDAARNLLINNIILFNILYGYNNDNLFENFDYSKLNLEGYNVGNKFLKDKMSKRRKSIIKDLGKEPSFKLIDDRMPQHVKEKMIKNNQIIKEKWNAKLIKCKTDLNSVKKYVKNKEIITHMRNAITHGYYKFSYGTEVKDTYIEFYDKEKDNKKTFEISMSLNQFSSLVDKIDEVGAILGYQPTSITQEKILRK